MLENSADPDLLRQALQVHREVLADAGRRAGAGPSEGPDLAQATHLHARLDVLLDRWGEFEDRQRRRIAETVRYVVRVPDDVDDVDRDAGLDDDARRVDELLAELLAELADRS